MTAVRRSRMAGHQRTTEALGERTNPRQRAPGGWKVGCACGWSEQPFTVRRDAESAYTAHLRSALPICTRCKEPKPPYRMSKASSHLCKPCRTAATKEWAEANPKQWDRHQRKYYLRLKYGLTVEQADALYAAQGNRCAICGQLGGDSRGFRLHIDHCHATGKVRGALCNNCNAGLGNFREDPDLMIKAMEYLAVHSSENAA